MEDAQRNIKRTNPDAARHAGQEIGDMGERLSYIRDTLLVLQRAVSPFVAEHGDKWLEDKVKARLKMAGSDVVSLNDYEVHLTDKIQFLLDAALGFINVEQNDLFKVLTIASVIGIPPTFMLASMYGMNFHNLPELSWSLWLYQWGLFLIVLEHGDTDSYGLRWRGAGGRNCTTLHQPPRSLDKHYRLRPPLARHIADHAFIRIKFNAAPSPRAPSFCGTDWQAARARKRNGSITHWIAPRR